MRKIRLHGSEGGGAETNRPFLPIAFTVRSTLAEASRGRRG